MSMFLKLIVLVVLTRKLKIKINCLKLTCEFLKTEG